MVYTWLSLDGVQNISLKAFKTTQLHYRHFTCSEIFLSSSPVPMASPAKVVARELRHLIRVYTDGSVERIVDSPYLPPSPNPDPATGVSSKDIIISENPKLSARLYLPKIQHHHQKLPILVHFHGGAFCLGSAFSYFEDRKTSLLVSQAKVVAVSVEYRLAPEDPLPAAYEDGWATLNWVAAHFKAQNEPNRDPWLLNYGDFDRLYISGESSGGNIVHNIAMRAGSENLEGNVKILGAFISHSYFWGSKPIGSENDRRDNPKLYLTLDSKTIGTEPGVDHDKTFPALVWDFVYPSAPGGLDNPMLNPEGPGAPSLARLGCSRLLICVAGEDELRDRGVRYYESVKESGWKGELELHEDEGEGHGFYAINLESVNAKNMFKRWSSFLE
ncbi:2-hydroxyisoflavanone dehydratase-like [Tripterygium wilfordii]|uniref:2-hydroxyisoflavanone dehydratase-like n=1 Tax=Tripterygium wilfordii TaxID=458696 RepID=UPI0018F7FFB5|nr:2-hydroxyisoflavanone dehydratase-like [Tripterygium wilfordii]